MTKKIIAVLGMCGSGKSVACEYFSEKENMLGVYFGGRTMEELERQGLEVTPENERKVREGLREKHGMAVFAHLSIEKIEAAMKETRGPFVFVDGLYSFEEYEVLEKAFSKQIIMIEIYVDKEIRYQRLGTRKHRSLTPEQARERDLSEIRKLNKGGAIAFSDYKIANNHSVDDLKNKLEIFLKQITI